MSKKEKILAKLSEQRKGLKKVNLSIMSDLKAALENMRSYDIEYDYDKAFTEYEYALNLMEQARQAANAYVESYSKFEENVYEHWEAYTEASTKFGELELQLDYLGIEPSSEVESYRDEIVEGERQGQEAFGRTQSDFGKHNDLVDISDFN